MVRGFETAHDADMQNVRSFQALIDDRNQRRARKERLRTMSAGDTTHTTILPRFLHHHR